MTNREAHAQSVLFRCEEWFENFFGKFDAGAIIANLGPDGIFRLLHAKPQHAFTGERAHGFHTVANDIDQDSLGLDAIDRDGTQVLRHIYVHPTACAPALIRQKFPSLPYPAGKSA